MLNVVELCWPQHNLCWFQHESGDIDEDEIKVIEKLKEQVEKSIVTIIKVSKSLESYQS